MVIDFENNASLIIALIMLFPMVIVVIRVTNNKFLDYLRRRKLRFLIRDRENKKTIIARIKENINQLKGKLGSELELDREILMREKKNLQNTNYLSYSGKEVLENASIQEREDLAKLLGASNTSSVTLFRRIRYLGSNDIARLGRKAKGEDPDVPYDEVVTDVAKDLKIPTDRVNTLYEKEVAIIETFTNNMLGEMSPGQRKEFFNEMEAEAKKNGQSYTSVIAGSGGIALANASGFGIYLAASTAVGAVTGALGITLPFVVYTSMSKAIAAFIGPVGWAGLGLWVTVKLGSPNMKKTIPGVIIIAAMRAKLQYEKQTRLEQFNNTLKLIDLQDDLEKSEGELELAEVKLSEFFDSTNTQAAA